MHQRTNVPTYQPIARITRIAISVYKGRVEIQNTIAETWGGRHGSVDASRSGRISPTVHQSIVNVARRRSPRRMMWYILVAFLVSCLAVYLVSLHEPLVDSTSVYYCVPSWSLYHIGNAQVLFIVIHIAWVQLRRRRWDASDAFGIHNEFFLATAWGAYLPITQASHPSVSTDTITTTTTIATTTNNNNNA